MISRRQRLLPYELVSPRDHLKSMSMVNPKGRKSYSGRISGRFEAGFESTLPFTFGGVDVESALPSATSITTGSVTFVLDEFADLDRKGVSMFQRSLVP